MIYYLSGYCNTDKMNDTSQGNKKCHKNYTDFG